MLNVFTAQFKLLIAFLIIVLLFAAISYHLFTLTNQIKAATKYSQEAVSYSYSQAQLTHTLFLSLTPTPTATVSPVLGTATHKVFLTPTLKLTK